MASARALVGTSGSGLNPSIRTDELGNILFSDVLNDRLDRGKLYYVFDRATLAIAKTFLIRVGANPVDFKWNVKCGLSAPVDLTEGVSVSATGSAVTIFNYTRSVVTAPAFTVFSGPTTSNGTVIFQTQAGFGVGLTPVAGDSLTSLAEPDIPWRLKPNTDYTFAYTPVASIVALFHGVFYEVV